MVYSFPEINGHITPVQKPVNVIDNSSFCYKLKILYLALPHLFQETFENGPNRIGCI